ncbi:oleosin 1 [Punica granatum]|uniref:Uncharacterized protein n=2 Tax=Punica granatum TaxID=22663 RepID=A0A218VXW7_PUNGR|nr:oleosin 1 [Punica granatum]OWM65163.1 hypothetical protein CDL15_Pgr008750 [Punica granatum]PKI43894.1 hypothetical protein CRG98_035728 [Punica granatum]
MAERHSSPGQQPGVGQKAPQSRPAQGGGPVLRKFHEHASSPTQLIGFLALIVSGGILLLLTGLTATGLVMSLIFFTPLLIISSPIWFPVCTVIFIGITWTLSMCGFGVAVLAGVSWLYRYFKGFNPPGSGQVDYARNRIYDTASHMKDYAREYGGYLQSKAKDAAPGA